MAQDVEIWFDTAPAPAAIELAVARFGALHEQRDGVLRLVEGDEPVGEGVPLVLIEVATAPVAVKQLLPTARAALRASAVLSSSRAFWMANLAAEVQRRLGGVIFVPSTGEAFAEAAEYVASLPGEHGGHGHGHGEGDA